MRTRSIKRLLASGVRHGRHRAAAIVLAMAIVPRGAARAQDGFVPPPPVPEAYELQWSAPPECPNEDSIRARVFELQAATVEGGGTAVVSGRVQPSSSDGYELTLTTEFAGRIDTRRLQSRRCDALAESTALVLAVALDRGFERAFAAMDKPLADPVQASAPQDEATARDPPSVPASQPRTAAERRRPVARPSEGEVPRRSLHGFVRAAASTEIGVLGPHVTGGPHLALGLSWMRARVELYGTYLAPRLRLTDDDEGGRFQAGVVGARGCFIARSNHDVRIPVCGGIEGGVTRVDTRGLAVARTTHAPWLGPSVAIGVTRIFGERIGPWAALESVVRAVGRNYALRGETAFVQLPVSVRLMLGVEILLGRRRGEKRPER